MSSTVVRILLPHQWKRIGSGRTAGCWRQLSKSDGRLWRKSPCFRTRAESRLALGRKRRTRVAGSLAEGKMGMMGTVG